MSQTLKTFLSQFNHLNRIPLNPEWKLENGYVEITAGEHAPVLSSGEMVVAYNEHCWLLIQGSELGNIIVSTEFYPEIGEEDKVTVHFSNALNTFLKEKFAMSYKEELIHYLFGETNNFATDWGKLEPAHRERFITLYKEQQPVHEKEVMPSNERVAYFRYGTSEVVAMYLPDGMYSVTERLAPENDLPIYHVTNHTDKDKAIEEFKRCVNRALG